MSARSNLVSSACEYVAALHLVDPRDGWPALARLGLGDSEVGVALHASVVGSHARREYELRFQNPAGGEVVQDPDGYHPVLLGVVREGPEIYVVLDGVSRVGREARFSVLFRAEAVAAARSTGWGEYRSTTGEVIYATTPELLPAALQVIALGVEPELGLTGRAIAAAGVAPGVDDDAAERARRSISALVRDHRFSRVVRAAYGQRCAICGLGAGLVVGAHIYPASAPGSEDVVQNGLALCQNHHAAFDAHKVFIAPDSGTIRFHPDLLAGDGPALEELVRSDRARVAVVDADQRPDPGNFARRYEFFGLAYDWARDEG